MDTTEDTAKCPEERDLSKNGGCITDAEIGRQVLAGAKSENLNDRPLQKAPSVWLANDTEPSEALLTGSAEPFDQFKVYEEMSGAIAKYDESLYTTLLDPSKITAEQEMKAAELAASIESARSTNIHIQEERGQIVPGDGDGMNEEEKFSAVLHEVGEFECQSEVIEEEPGVTAKEVEEPGTHDEGPQVHGELPGETEQISTFDQDRMKKEVGAAE